MIEVHAVKYVEDPLRREPKNVGVIASSASAAGSRRVASRFLGQGAGDALSGRAIHVPSDVYRDWIAYFLSKLREDSIEDVDRLMSRRPTSFYLDHVATLLDEDDVEAAAARMYPALVRDNRREARERLDDQVEHLLLEAGLVDISRDLAFEGSLRGQPVPFEFAFGYESGRTHLMDKVVASPTKPQLARKSANDFAWRTFLAEEAGVAHDFIAFVDLAQVPESYADDELVSLYRVGQVADVSRPGEVVEMLASLAH